MKFKIDHDLHIHSLLSSCSCDPEQTNENILAYAKQNGFSTVCLTDHFWDKAVPGASDWYKPQDYEHLCLAKPLPECDGIRFLFGCETDMRFDMTVGVSPEKYDLFDFIIVPTTHLHMRGFAISESDAQTNAGRAKAWIEKLDALLDMPLPFHKVGIAHLTCSLINNKSKEDLYEVLNLITDSEMERLFKKAAKVGAGIELNLTFSDEEADIILRPYRIAKAAGCKFYLGSDAHHPKTFSESMTRFERVVDFLELEESDKFII
jgi:histidinol phosphatase-like PHP family hydrolase